HTFGAGHISDGQSLAAYFDDHLREVVDRDHFVGPDIHRPREIGSHQTQCSLYALVDVEERPRLLAVTPDFDFAALRRNRHLSAERSGRLLATTFPRPLRAEDIVVTCDSHLHSIVPGVCEIQPLAEQLLPTVLAVGRGRISRI